MKIVKFFREVCKRLSEFFRRHHHHQNQTGGKDTASDQKSQVQNDSSKSDRTSYIVQIGLDFGTAFTKCICREYGSEKVWIDFSKDDDSLMKLPFLINSSLTSKGAFISHHNDLFQYSKNSLPHLKMALEAVSMREFESPFLQSFRAASGSDEKVLARFVEDCAVYFLGGMLGNVRKRIGQKLTGFGDHPNDYLAVNMAVPVADAQKPDVEKCFMKVLRLAWVLADELAGFPEMSFSKISRKIDEASEKAETKKVRDVCHIYPEVSANMQGFVKSRVAQQSPSETYLFTDVGSGTVDQCVFTFTRFDDEERLNYLAAAVLPLGSSWIERWAAEIIGKTDRETFEKLRIAKENGTGDPTLKAALRSARERLRINLTRETIALLSRSKKMLYRGSQMNEIMLLFGGGGDCKDYRDAVYDAFKSHIFQKDNEPHIISLPISIDLKLPHELDLEEKALWRNRLSVAYGLSFFKDELAKYRYPNEIQMPED